MRIKHKAWDVQQQAVFSLQAPCSASVIGPPGSGKTAVAVALAVRIVQENPEAKIAVLSPDRRAASDLRNEISRQLGYLPGSVNIQSITAFAFTIVSAYAQYVGRREPELLSGPDQDALLKEYFDLIVAGHVPGNLPRWSDDEDAAQLPAYRAEFRDLITRAAELELSAADLAALGEQFGEPIWVSGAEILTGYENALATQAAVGHQNPDVIDHARLLTQAAAMLQGWDRAKTQGGGKLNIHKPHWDWVIVDDLENSTLALRALLRGLKAEGTSIVTFGDPDAAVQGFRGGVAHLPALLTRSESSGGLGAKRFYLSNRYRAGGELGKLVSQVTSGIHTAGAGRHRSAEFVADEDARFPTTAHIFANEDEEIAYVATRMRRLHLLEGVPYSDMAVLTRSAAMHRAARRSFLRYGVPIAPLISSDPLRDQRAVAALIDVIELALGDPTAIDTPQIEHVLTGPLIGIDPLDLRRLSRELRGWELAAGGSRPESELLAQVVTGGKVMAKVPELQIVHTVIERIRAARDRGALGEEVLWEAWDGVGVAEQWREQALGVGAHADAADSDLDAVISLFRVAQRQADRDPANAGIGVLLEALEDQDIPEDSIARTGGAIDEVTLATPSSTIGRSWDYVAILGVNDGTWPNTKLRNPLTKVPKLVNIVLGSEMAGQTVESGQLVRDVIDDELRMFLKALTRARKSVVVTSTRGDGVQPSRFLQWLFPEAKSAAAVASILDTAGLTGQLRQALASGDEVLSVAAESVLQELAGVGVGSARPETWVDQLEPSTHEGVSGDIYVSPSRIESTMRCPLRAFLDSIGSGSATDTRALDIGTLIHTLAEEFPRGPASAVKERGEQLLARLDLPDDFDGVKAKADLGLMFTTLGAYLEKDVPSVHVEQKARDVLEDSEGTVTVSSRLDRIEVTNGKAHVIDFKTSSQAITKAEAEANPQLRVYQWLVNRGAIDEVAGADGAKLVYVKKPLAGGLPSERTQGALDADQMAETQTTILNTAKVQRGGSFAAKPNSMCRHCPYSASCPAVGSGRIFS